MMLLLLLLRNLKLICTSLSLELLNLAQPSLFRCFKIWKRLNLVSGAGGVGRVCTCGAINNKLGGVAWHGRALDYAVNIWRTRVVYQNIAGPCWPEETRTRCSVPCVSETCRATEWGLRAELTNQTTARLPSDQVLVKLKLITREAGHRGLLGRVVRNRTSCSDVCSDV